MSISEQHCFLYISIDGGVLFPRILK